MKTIAIDLGGTIIKTGLLDGENLLEFRSENAISEDGLKGNLPVLEKMVGSLLENN